MILHSSSKFIETENCKINEEAQEERKKSRAIYEEAGGRFRSKLLFKAPSPTKGFRDLRVCLLVLLLLLAAASMLAYILNILFFPPPANVAKFRKKIIEFLFGHIWTLILVFFSIL